MGLGKQVGSEFLEGAGFGAGTNTREARNTPTCERTPPPFYHISTTGRFLEDLGEVRHPPAQPPRLVARLPPPALPVWSMDTAPCGT